jgi:hypothetical protein
MANAAAAAAAGSTDGGDDDELHVCYLTTLCLLKLCDVRVNN